MSKRDNEHGDEFRSTHQMTWDIHEVEILRTDKLNRRSFEESIMFFADISRILDSFSSDLMNIRFGTDYSD